MEKNIIINTLLILTISNSTYAKEATLSISKYIDLLKKNDPQFEMIINDNLKKDYHIDKGLPSRELLLSASAEYGFALDDSANTNQTAVSISKNFIESGTSLSLSRSQNNLSDREETISKVELEQKIYNDGLGSNTRKKKSLLESEVQIIDLQIKESYEDYIKERLEAYFDLGRLFTELKSSKEIYKEAKKLYDQVLAKKKKSVATDTDLKRAKLQMLVREDELLESETAYNKTVRTLSAYIGQQVTKDIPEFEFDFHKKMKSIPRTREDLESLRSFKIKDTNLQNSKLSLDIEKNNGGISASIIAGASMDDSKRYTTTIKNEEMLIGLRIDIPFGDTAQNALEKEANYNYIKSRLEKQNYISEILSELAGLEIEIANKQKKLKLAKEKAELSESIVSEDTKRYENGRMDLEELITSRNNRATYKKAYISEQMTYNKLIIEYLAATDSLID